MARRKNTKFIDPRYFMNEKMERLDEGGFDVGAAEAGSEFRDDAARSIGAESKVLTVVEQAAQVLARGSGYNEHSRGLKKWLRSDFLTPGQGMIAKWYGQYTDDDAFKLEGIESKLGIVENMLGQISKMDHFEPATQKYSFAKAGNLQEEEESDLDRRSRERFEQVEGPIEAAYQDFYACYYALATLLENKKQIVRMLGVEDQGDAQKIVNWIRGLKESCSALTSATKRVAHGEGIRV